MKINTRRQFLLKITASTEEVAAFGAFLAAAVVLGGNGVIVEIDESLNRRCV